MSYQKKEMLVSLDQMIARYQNDETLRDIAQDAGVSSQTVGRRLVEAGIPLRGHRKTAATRKRQSQAHRLDLPEDKIRELHAQGMSCQEIARVLGCDDETIRERLIELDLPRLAAKARPEKNYFWRGGYAVDVDGYILEHRPEHPQATIGGYVRQHRLVMEKMLGRYLAPEEVVDHKNRDTSDNDPGNLELYATNADHLAATLAGRKNLPPEERERLRREAVLRARRRVAAILAASGNGADQSP